MKATGIVRRIDDLGRVVIPKEIRRTMRIREGDPLEIFTDNDGEVVFKKYSPVGEMTPFALQYADVMSRACGLPVLICDRDHLLQLPSDLFCEVLAPRDLSTPAYVGTFVERINAVRSRRPVQVVTFDGEGDFPEGMLDDPTVAPVVRRVAGFDESVLENIAHELDEETEPPQETEER